tara:strand:- start:193 stop:306 length:114 start_codon:yes stop_codon:yes gene_type:complete
MVADLETFDCSTEAETVAIALGSLEAWCVGGMEGCSS